MPPYRKRYAMSRYRPYVTAAGRVVGRFAGGLLRRYATNKLKNYTQGRRTVGVGVTGQYDKKSVYRKRYMPRRKKKQWKRFVRKVRAVNLSEIGTQSVIRNNSLARTIASTDGQDVTAVALYGKYGSNALGEIGMSDLYDVLSNDGDANNIYEKTLWKSAILDITFSNTGSTRLEVDAYHMVYLGKAETRASLKAEYVAALGANIPVTGAGTAVTYNTRGWTPFEASIVSSKGYKILRKTKYFLGTSDSFTYQIRDPKNRVISMSDVTTQTASTECALRKITQFVFFVTKVCVGSENTGTNSKYDIGATRSYKYCIMEQNQDTLMSL